MTKRSRGRDERPTEEVVDQAYDTALEHCFFKNHVIQKASDIVANEVFSNEWMVEWGGHKTAMEYFQNKHVKRALRHLMTTIRSQLRYKNYAGIYIVKNRGEWVREFEASVKLTGGVPSAQVLLPCGVITAEMGDYVRIAPRGAYSATRILQFRPRHEELARTYDFAVFDTGACFYSTSVDHSIQGEGGGGGTDRDRFSALVNSLKSMGGSAGESHIRPFTKFEELFCQYDLFKEAQVYTYDAGFGLAYPLSYITANKIPEAPVDETPDEVLSMTKDMQNMQSRQKGLHEMKFTLQQGSQIISTLRGAMSSITGRSMSVQDAVSPVAGMGFVSGTEGDTRPETVRKARALQFKRVDPTENIEPIPDFVTVTPGAPPSSIFDINVERTNYEIAVCGTMGVPHSLLRTQIETGHSSGNSNITLSENILAATVGEEIKIYKEIFDFLYMNVWGPLDSMLFESVASDMEHMSDEEYNTRETQGIVKWISSMRKREMAGESYATIQFEMLTVRSVEGLRGLIEAQQLGLVTRQLVERNASRLFGYTIGSEPSKFVTKSDPALKVGVNQPLQQPVSADTNAKLMADRDRASGKGDDEKEEKKKRKKKKQRTDK